MPQKSGNDVVSILFLWSLLFASQLKPPQFNLANFLRLGHREILPKMPTNLGLGGVAYNNEPMDKCLGLSTTYISLYSQFGYAILSSREGGVVWKIVLLCSVILYMMVRIGTDTVM